LTSEQEAVRVGLTWSVLTASFDFGFGHFVAGKSWRELAHDYDVTAGRVWIVILVWMAVAPEGARRLGVRAGGAQS
jgi:apolipoprotein N-acyltransferase